MAEGEAEPMQEIAGAADATVAAASVPPASPSPQPNTAARSPSTQPVAAPSAGVVPGGEDWWAVLQPVRKMATNVGARIRNLVNAALLADPPPPAWARKKLEWSISKEVYKGNAAGPTKVRSQWFEPRKLNFKCLDTRAKQQHQHCGAHSSSSDLSAGWCITGMRRFPPR